MASSVLQSLSSKYPGVNGPPPAMPIEDALKQITEMSTLPNVAMKVIEVGNNPEAGANELRAILETDPALSSRLLRCVNSAAYGLVYKCSTLQAAVSYLGFKTVRNLALTASVSDIFKRDEPAGLYRRTGLWRHMVSVAIAARMLAMRREMPNFEEAFVAGLLHDIGIVLEDQYCHAGFAWMMNNINRDQPLSASEQAALGFDHTVLGARVAEQWKMPPQVVAAIHHHHTCQTYRGEHTDLVACVELANLLCTIKGITSVGLALGKPSIAAADLLGLTRADVKVLADDLDDQLKQNQALFKL